VNVRYDAPIVYFYYKEGTQLGFPEIKEMVTLAEKLSGGKPYLTFSDVRGDIDVTQQGRKYLANTENMPLFRGAAILVKSTLFSYAVNFVAHFNRKPHPYRAFLTEEKATEWLLGLPLD
jgi:hypothetical protein